jgi:peptidoglycan-N-acetylglucosamine deacetylase
MSKPARFTGKRRWRYVCGLFALCAALALAAYVAEGRAGRPPAAGPQVALASASVSSPATVARPATVSSPMKGATAGAVSIAGTAPGNPTNSTAVLRFLAEVEDRRHLQALHRLLPRATPTGPAQETPSGKRIVALTFDDGPSRFTQQVASMLQAQHVPGTFFFIGKMVGGYPGIVSRLRKEGFEVENHTWGHVDLTTLDPAGLASQIRQTDAVLGSAKFLRPPSAKFNATVIGAVHQEGLKLALWNVDTLDWLNKDPDSILDNVVKETKPGAVILMHDGGGDRTQTVAALPRVIAWLRGQGYSFVRLDQLGSAARRGTLK